MRLLSDSTIRPHCDAACLAMPSLKVPWMGRVRRTTSRERLPYLSWNGARCSVKFLSLCDSPASRSATLSPASARRLQAQPPEALEPTTTAANVCLEEFGIG